MTIKKDIGNGATGKTKPLLFNIAISADDRKMIDELRQEHSVNISQFVRNSIRELHAKLTRSGCKGNR
jgi:hypothetical protein